jgi:hypothetical protein
MNARTSEDANTAQIAVAINGSLSAVQEEVACKEGKNVRPCVLSDHPKVITLKRLKDIDKTSEIIKGKFGFLRETATTNHAAENNSLITVFVPTFIRRSVYCMEK